MVKKIGRRSFLLGSSSMVVLPALESILPAKLFAQSQNITRSIVIYCPNGLRYEEDYDYWYPSQPGAFNALPEYLQPLANFKNDMILLENIKNEYGRNQAYGRHRDGGGGHARAASSFLTGAHVNKVDDNGVYQGYNNYYNRTGIYVGQSFDQKLASTIFQGHNFPSMVLANQRFGGPDSGYASIYKNMSWVNPRTPANYIHQPHDLFLKMFPSIQANDFEQRRTNKKSILDFVLSEANSLNNSLSQGDKRKIDQYFSSIRDVERRLFTNSPAECQKPSNPGNSLHYLAKMEAFFDLITIAVSCDLTRNVVFALGSEANQQNFSQYLNFSTGWHSASHWTQNKDVHVEQYQAINQWIVKRLPYFLNQLKNTAEGDKNLLYNSIVTFGSGITDGGRHNHYNLPLLLFGHGSGKIKSGHYYKMSSNTPVANLWLTIMNALGLNITQFGDSNDRLKVIES